MLLGEPQRTQFDLHFPIAGIPVRVHPLFWLVSLIMGYNGSSANAGVLVLIWVAVVFVSILAHEFGHALTMRFFGQSSHVVLYMMGGLAIPDSMPYSFGGGNSAASPRNRVLILLAGPGAGFLLAGLTVGLVYMSGGSVDFSLLEIVRGSNIRILPYFPIEGVSNNFVRELFHNMLWVNIFWGLVNLLPLYPLDGGQIAREVFVHFNARDGIRHSLILSIVTGGIVAVLGLTGGQPYLGIMFGLLAFSSYQILRQFSGRGGGFGGGSPW